MENKVQKEYRAPATVLKKVLFTVETASDAADFKKVQKTLQGMLR